MKLAAALTFTLVFSAAAARAGVTQGTLVARDGKRIVDVPLAHTGVAIHVDGMIASVAVVQTFHNPYAHAIEAIYAFPLPAGAAVDHFELKTGEVTIRGEIHKKSEAKRIYERARSLGKIAALLEEESAGAFLQSVANIAPGAGVEVALHYFQELPCEDERYQLVFPMVMAPRPISTSAPNPPRFLPPDVRSAHDIALEVELDAGFPLRAIGSPSHRLQIDGQKIRIAADDTIPNKDFVLRWEIAAERPQAALFSDGRAFLLAIQPPKLEDAHEPPPRELVFAIDTSSSMRGAPLDKAKLIVRRVLAELGARDTFQIVAFSDRATALGARSIANRRENIALAGGWLETLEAGGGTEMSAGLAAALAFEPDPQRMRVVVFISDGYVGDDDAVLNGARAALGASRIFTFGIGSVLNRYLLEELAILGRGAFTGLRADEDEAAAIARFAEKIRRPVLTDIELDWGGLEVADLVPKQIADLYAGEPLYLRGRWPKDQRPAEVKLAVSGIADGRRVELPVLVSPAELRRSPSIGSVWAKARIQELTRARTGEEEITALALEYGLVTRYTAFVAVGEKTNDAGPARVVPIPLEAPEGLAGIEGLGAAYGTGIGAGSIGAYGHGAGGSVGIYAGSSMIGDALGRSEILHVLSKHNGAIKHCYELALARDPALAGRLVLHFAIGPEGKVHTAEIETSTLSAPEMERCVLARVRTVEFPAVSGGGVVEVNMPYYFQPPEKGATP